MPGPKKSDKNLSKADRVRYVDGLKMLHKPRRPVSEVKKLRKNSGIMELGIDEVFCPELPHDGFESPSVIRVGVRQHDEPEERLVLRVDLQAQLFEMTAEEYVTRPHLGVII